MAKIKEVNIIHGQYFGLSNIQKRSQIHATNRELSRLKSIKQTERIQRMIERLQSRLEALNYGI